MVDTLLEERVHPAGVEAGVDEGVIDRGRRRAASLPIHPITHEVATPRRSPVDWTWLDSVLQPSSSGARRLGRVDLDSGEDVGEEKRRGDRRRRRACPCSSWRCNSYLQSGPALEGLLGWVGIYMAHTTATGMSASDLGEETDWEEAMYNGGPPSPFESSLSMLCGCICFFNRIKCDNREKYVVTFFVIDFADYNGNSFVLLYWSSLPSNFFLQDI